MRPELVLYHPERNWLITMDAWGIYLGTALQSALDDGFEVIGVL